MYEAAAIILYLAERHNLDDLAPPVDHPLRGLFFQSLFYLSNTVQDTYKRFYYPERFSTDPHDAPKIKARSIEALLDCWKPVDTHLTANRPYHLGERFSLVDIYMVMLVTWFLPIEQLLETFPAIKACYGIVSQRPAIKSCLARQKHISVGKL